MQEHLDTPLVRWDGLHLALDMDMVERHVRLWLEPARPVKDVVLVGRGDAVEVTATVVWKGLQSRVAFDVGEVRLKHRFVGFRLRRPRVLGGLPVPRAAVEAILAAVGAEDVTLFRGEGIVVVDLRRWLPPEVDLTVLTLQGTGRALHVWFGPGSLADLPARYPLALPAVGGAAQKP